MRSEVSQLCWTLKMVHLQSSVSLDVLRNLLGLKSCDDVRRLSQLFPLVPDLLQFPQQIGDLHA